MTNSLKRRLHAVSSAFLLISTAHFSLAQNTNSGDIRGTVTDSTGAVIPGASVSILDTDTGVSKELVTNNDGIYDAVSILPGKYRITFSKEGFGKLVRDGIDLRVGVITIDGTLNVGAASQEVNISAEAPLLKTETGEQSTSLQTESMMQLPNVGENWANFTKLLPGAQGSGTGISVNGNLPYYSSFLADGGNTTLPHSANVDVSTFEIVSEVQINTSTFSAQYGVGGVVFNQISKGGTNQFHGSAYDYIQ
ncbi:MAG: carboxypeptidase regulatory-like domain-containing protein, partial [Bryobacteraceae bacterium]